MIWTKEMIKSLIDLYPTHTRKEISMILNVSVSSIQNKLHKLGMKKDDNAGRFKKGHIPINKGKKQHEFMRSESIERTKVTRFKPGHTPHNHKEIGHVRTDRDGYMWIKTDEPRTFKMLHVLIWMEHHPGELINKNEIIRFIDGDKTNLDPENLEKITRKQAAEITRETDGYIARTISRDKKIIKLLRTDKEIIDLKRKLLTIKRKMNVKA